MNARDEVLARIRSALGPDRAQVDVPRAYTTTSALADDERLALFIERVEDYKATVRRCWSNELLETVRTVLKDSGVRTIALPPRPPFEGDVGAERVTDDGSLSAGDLDRVDGVVTGCAVAIAVTGTVVLDASPDHGRRLLTLVPDYHLCVVRADQVVGSVPEAVARLDVTRPLTWISGPSATSDIELNRVEGVHGPRRLEVLVVQDPPAGMVSGA